MDNSSEKPKTGLLATSKDLKQFGMLFDNPKITYTLTDFVKIKQNIKNVCESILNDFENLKEQSECLVNKLNEFDNLIDIRIKEFNSK